MPKKAWLIFMIGIVAFGALFVAERFWIAPAQQQAASAGELMEPLPEVQVSDRDGNKVSLENMRGKVLVLNFWATWCAPCVAEIPFFNKVYAEFRERGVEFLAISEDAGGWKDIDVFLEKKTSIDYPIFLDEDERAAEAVGGLQGLPVTVFVDPQGRVAYKHVGITDIDVLRDNIQRLLPESREAGL